MDISKGYLRLFRKILDWDWYDNPYVKALFIHCLVSANTKNKKWRDLTIKRGQFVTSYEKLAITNGLTIQQTRTALKQLQLTKEIEYQSTNQYTIITVNNWDFYQPDNILISNPTYTPPNKPKGGQLTTTNNTNSNSNTSYINISLSPKEEKITKEEREILTNYVKKNNLANKSIRAYVNTMIKNGDHIEIIEQIKTKKQTPTQTKTTIKTDLKKVTNKLLACYFIGKYGDYTDEDHPQEVLNVMEKFNIESFTAATTYVHEYKEKENGKNKS